MSDPPETSVPGPLPAHCAQPSLFSALRSPQARAATPPARFFPPTTKAGPTSACRDPVRTKSPAEIPPEPVSQEVFTPPPAGMKPTIRGVRLILRPRPRPHPRPPRQRLPRRLREIRRLHALGRHPRPQPPSGGRTAPTTTAVGWGSDDSDLALREHPGESEIDLPDRDAASRWYSYNYRS